MVTLLSVFLELPQNTFAKSRPTTTTRASLVRTETGGPRMMRNIVLAHLLVRWLLANLRKVLLDHRYAVVYLEVAWEVLRVVEELELELTKMMIDLRLGQQVLDCKIRAAGVCGLLEVTLVRTFDIFYLEALAKDPHDFLFGRRALV